ncbi:MAG: hypothetical protein LUE96_12140 [Lachnospiraceae bacterium]|nr:hypothetical protein [Lachnospiraceae bacterium]
MIANTGANEFAESLTMMIIGSATLLVLVIAIKIMAFILKSIWGVIKRIFGITSRPKPIEANRTAYTTGGVNKLSNRYEYRKIDSLLQLTKCRVRLPRSKVIFDEQTYSRYMQNPYNADNLNTMAREILCSCSYKGEYPNVFCYTFTDSMIISEHHFISKKDIKIIISSNTRREAGQLLGILIHECMNVLSYYLKISYPENGTESGADVLAVYMGFYDYMVMGYNRIGYLRSAELSYIRREIEDYKRR